MLAGLEPIKTRIEQTKRATRDDILEALLVIDGEGASRTDELTALVEGIYSSDQTTKLLTSLDSYDT